MCLPEGARGGRGRSTSCMVLVLEETFEQYDGCGLVGVLDVVECWSAW